MAAIVDIETHTSDSEGSTLEFVTRKKRSRKSKSSKRVVLEDDTKAEMKRQVLKHKDRLVQEETSQEGGISLGVLKVYLKALTPTRCALMAVTFVFFVATMVCTIIWLGAWTNDSLKTASNTKPSQKHRALVFGMLGILQVLIGLGLCLAISLASIAASYTLHAGILYSVMRTPMSFFDTTPIGRILNRFSRDFTIIDSKLPQNVTSFLSLLGFACSSFVILLYTSPILFAPFIAFTAILAVFQRMYIATLRQLQRLDSVKSSPVFAFFSEMLMGTSTIRAFNKQDAFIKQADKLIDDSSRTYYMLYMCNRWCNISMFLCYDAFSLVTCIALVAKMDVIPSSFIGIAISMLMQLKYVLKHGIRYLADCETDIVAVERVNEYARLNPEAPWSLADKRPPQGWPQKATIEFRDYCVRYRAGMDLALKNVSCFIPARKKVGVVGRTGAGKSSLTLALFRILEAAHGQILIDGVNIADMGLHDLRAQLTIIPQDPHLFAGSLRYNLDPAVKYSDSDIWTALQRANIKEFVSNLQEGLLYECGEDGASLSVGQRQLVCLARALLRKTKVLILDEATAAVDMETDDLIQSTIRSEFSECTLITIAHRINTILDYDSIIVMDRGSLIEMDTPDNLLSNVNSVFYKMAKDAGIRMKV